MHGAAVGSRARVRMTVVVVAALVAALLVSVSPGSTSRAHAQADTGPTTITNYDADGTPVLKLDTDGNAIDAHSLSIHRFGSLYYLYGEAYACGFRWMAGSFCGFKVYSSPDLANWTYRGQLFDPTKDDWSARCNPVGCFRLKVAYNASTSTYVAWVNTGNGPGPTTPNAFYTLTSDNPAGPFKVTPNAPRLSVTGNNGDDDLFVDQDGTAYLAYTAMGNNNDHWIRVERLDSAYLNGASPTAPDASTVVDLHASTGQSVNPSYGSESPTLFRRGNLYYLVYGPTCPYCGGTRTLYSIATSPLGPWSAPMEINPDSCQGQPSFVAPVTLADDSTAYLFGSDQWMGGPHTDHNQSGDRNQSLAGLFWTPLSFNSLGRIKPFTCTPSLTLSMPDGSSGAPAPSPTLDQQASGPFHPVCDIRAGTPRTQTFRAGATGTLRRVDVSVYRRYVSSDGETPNAPLTVTLSPVDSSSGAATSSPLMTQDVAATDITYAPRTVSITPVTPVLVTAGRSYAVQVSSTSTTACYGTAVSGSSTLRFATYVQPPGAASVPHAVDSDVASVLPASIRSRDYNYAPTSRDLAPVKVTATNGTVAGADQLLATGGGTMTLTGTGSSVVYDFGQEVGGPISAQVQRSDSSQTIGLAYSESSQYIGTDSDWSSGGQRPDQSEDLDVDGRGNGTTTKAHERGGFRYLTVFLRTAGWVKLTGLSVHLTFAPTMTNLHDYPNYFLSSDDLLNRIWYAGAYTVQTNTLDPTRGRYWNSGPVSSGWDNSATIGVGTSVLADGAKRDRAVWPGDLGISLPTAYVSTDDLLSTKNSLIQLYSQQRDDGQLPYAAKPINFWSSDTYSMWTLLGTSTYVTYSNDADFARTIWPQYQKGLALALTHLDASHLFVVTNPSDWLPSRSGESLEATAIAEGVLRGAAYLARYYLNDSASAATYDHQADLLRNAARSLLYDPVSHLYREAPGSALYPQDGNALALWFGLAGGSGADPDVVATALEQRMSTYGAPSPEAQGQIGTFPGGMEVHGLFQAGHSTAALALIRREWGYMLNAPTGTNSTFWEGFKSDGSFGYMGGGKYMSASHGWATGPTSALTFYLLGLRPDIRDQVQVVPHTGDVTSAEGRLTTPKGWVEASWSRDPVSGRFAEHVSASGARVSRIAVPKTGDPNVVITVNGQEVWGFGGPTDTSTYTVDQDSSYFYIHATPGTGSGTTDDFNTQYPPMCCRFTVVAQPASVVDTGYTPCAAAGGYCTITSPRVVAYGAPGHWVYRWANTSLLCANGTFGTDPDPDPGVVKTCSAAPGPGPSGPGGTGSTGAGPAGWQWCAHAGDTCWFTGRHRVAIGANGLFSYQDGDHGVTCSASIPQVGQSYDCYVADTSPPKAWTSCAAEGSVCHVAAGSPIWYGANGIYRVVTAQGDTSCSNDALGGDPVLGVLKSCYVDNNL